MSEHNDEHKDEKKDKSDIHDLDPKKDPKAGGGVPVHGPSGGGIHQTPQPVPPSQT